MKRFDTIVLGLGAMGSAALCHLARRGNSVLGIDRHSPPHSFGSTHGDTRITRVAIGEGAQYTPLALRSHQLWRELERETGQSLMTNNGGLVISSAAKTSINHVENFFENTVAAARRFGIAHALLDASEIRRRFPPFNVAADEYGYFEPEAGFVRPEACVAANLGVAEARGATIHRNETVRGFDPEGKAVTVTTDRATYAADRLIVSAGAWLSDFIAPELARHFKVYRQTLLWFDAGDSAASFLPHNFPIFIWELQGRKYGIYGFPAIDGALGGVKVATERYDETTSPETVDRQISETEIAATYDELVAPFLPALSRRCVKAAVCLYTVTPDFGFVIDWLPGSDRVIVASPCSGHGFKHSAAIGEALAQIVIDGDSRIDLSAFKMNRFAA